MLKRMILSCVMAATIGMGLVSAVTPAEAHRFRDNSGLGFNLFFGSPGYYDNGYDDYSYSNNGIFNNGYLDNDYYGDGYYNNRYYDNGGYRNYRHIRRHVSKRCHIGTVRYQHRMHEARICNGRVTKVY